jgi:hypothetical protein
LIGRFLEGKALGEALVRVLINDVGMPGARAALRIDLEKLGRRVSNALCRTRPSLLPLAAAELVERRVLALGACVAGDQIEAARTGT